MKIPKVDLRLHLMLTHIHVHINLHTYVYTHAPDKQTAKWDNHTEKEAGNPGFCF